jgi:hypothetical protein
MRISRRGTPDEWFAEAHFCILLLDHLSKTLTRTGLDPQPIPVGCGQNHIFFPRFAQFEWNLMLRVDEYVLHFGERV